MTPKRADYKGKTIYELHFVEAGLYAINLNDYTALEKELEEAREEIVTLNSVTRCQLDQISQLVKQRKEARAECDKWKGQCWDFQAEGTLLKARLARVREIVIKARNIMFVSGLEEALSAIDKEVGEKC